MPFSPGYVYPLKDATRFDDELGVGYGFVALADYGPITSDCFVHDAWIVNAKGERHPGLNVSPVPIRADDVILTEGRLAEPQASSSS